MTRDRVIKALELEEMSPDERAQLVKDNSLDSLDDLDPEFRTRVEAKSRRIAEERGLLDSERS